ncbi:hypothetical protein FOMPIDRAFT_1127674 [Fomitopsis schrenkii]|uniref:Uncharacterized protein n=1 Tax=Fomitopsis schrenkii TaxID=2126942 RepID=S8DXS4_FOMSC|nr:hypothetical protein FOMPIDRAFT_1127674 [Fomitopsis schrenkii]
MLAKVFVYALLPFVVVNAAPIERRGRNDLLCLTRSVAQSVLNAEGTYLLTSSLHRILTRSSSASSVYKSATHVLGTSTAHVHATVTTISNIPIVEVTSVGGSAITLATLTSASGTNHHSQPVATTTFAGHTFVVPSSTWASVYPTSNGAVGTQMFGASKPMVMGAITVLTAVLGGVFVVL